LSQAQARAEQRVIPRAEQRVILQVEPVVIRRALVGKVAHRVRLHVTPSFRLSIPIPLEAWAST